MKVIQPVPTVQEFMLSFDIAWPILETLHNNNLADNLIAKTITSHQVVENTFLYEVWLMGDFSNHTIADKLNGIWIAFTTSTIPDYNLCTTILKTIKEAKLLYSTREAALANPIVLSV
jgi:hypothetical protein